MDNCAIHHDEEIHAIVVGECGECRYTFISEIPLLSSFTEARLIYLPPYSPDFNPIEQTFHSVKAWLRRHEREATCAAVRPWLIHQAIASVTAEMAEGWIGNCGY